MVGGEEKTIIHDFKLTGDGWVTGADLPENVRRSSFINVILLLQPCILYTSREIESALYIIVLDETWQSRDIRGIFAKRRREEMRKPSVSGARNGGSLRSEGSALLGMSVWGRRRRLRQGRW